MTLDGQPLLSSITWQPFGPVSSWQWANGSSYSRSFDQDGQIISYSTGSGSKTLGYDAAGNITGISTAIYSYDEINRLIAANDAAFDLHWNYDANGNRLSENHGLQNTVFTIDANSNRLLAVGGNSYQNDTNGSLVNDSVHSYQYDVQGRMTSVDSGNTASYRYNAMGQRTYKSAVISGTTQQRLFAYDGWQLLGEYDTSGVAKQETIWLGNLPVVVLQSGSVYQIYPDQLGTPRVITNAANTVIWRWDSDPFGTTAANDDPDGDGTRFTYNLRFPGQYYDAETGKHYNYFRDYDPSTGRYVESDPIGLRGGMNTYAYVNAMPVGFADPRGLLGYLVVHITGTVANPQNPNNIIVSGTVDYYGAKGEHFYHGEFRSGARTLDETIPNRGPTPIGSYKIVGPVHDKTQEDNNGAFCDPSGNCWSVPMEPITNMPNNRCPFPGDRDNAPCAVHPEGGAWGTQGCVGITDQNSLALKLWINNSNPSEDDPVYVDVYK